MSIYDIIYDIAKFVASRYFERIKDTNKIEKEILLIIEKVSDPDIKEMLDSGVFIEYLQSSKFKDVLNSCFQYSILDKKVLFKTLGSQDDFTMEHLEFSQDITKNIAKNIYETYKKDNTSNIPSIRKIEKTLSFILETIKEALFKTIPINEQSLVFLINQHTDFLSFKLKSDFDKLKNDIHLLLKQDTYKSNSDYENIKNEYYKILKENNSEAHIYLLDKFPFNKFYVPPILQNYSLEDDDFPFLEDLDVLEKDNDGWKYIFDRHNMVYIVGGAGYGKSLFTKKIINDYQQMNIFKSEEYLVIYGELKNFYEQNSYTPLSLLQFLQNCITSTTLMDETSISLDFIEYYLKRGRCLILLDALDEVEKSKRADLHSTLVSNLKNLNPNNKICITSRERGFIPEKNIEVFKIRPLSREQIEKYVDKIIALKKFDKSDKEAFMQQTYTLVNKGFLNSFLVLSLLINIYKGERELPENKLELYQKCFEYIANKREKEKTSVRYDWKNITPIMKENTFIELSEMCFPNNRNVDKNEVKERLIDIYKNKYPCDADTENAIDEFLVFCSDRTELFVPSAEDKFKFFHRSFFEYFYSLYIFTRYTDAEQILDKFLKFDVDSEVFELTVAMLKQKYEDRYQALLDLMFTKAYEEFNQSNPKYTVFNILLLSMQVVDDVKYKNDFLKMIIEYKKHFINNDKLRNLFTIINIYYYDSDYHQAICEAYQDECKLRLLKNCCYAIKSLDDYILNGKTEEEFFNLPQNKISKVISKIKYEYNKSDRMYFYNYFYFTTHDLKNDLNTLSELEIRRLLKRKTEKNMPSFSVISTALKRFNKMSDSNQKTICEAITFV